MTEAAFPPTFLFGPGRIAYEPHVLSVRRIQPSEARLRGAVFVMRVKIFPVRFADGIQAIFRFGGHGFLFVLSRIKRRGRRVRAGTQNLDGPYISSGQRLARGMLMITHRSSPLP